jgi:phospholipase C
MLRRQILALSVAILGAALAACSGNSSTVSINTSSFVGTNADSFSTTTPIKHLVVIYNENISFDHYFATYPVAANPAGEPVFKAAAGTPAVNGLSGNLLTSNPVFLNAANGTGKVNPFRLDRTQAATADQDHNYTPEQQAFDNGAMDLFPLYTGGGETGVTGVLGTTGLVMGYYDGNTVTAMWNYAQNFAMSDNAYTDTFGPSSLGAIEASSGQTNGLQLVLNKNNTPPSTLASQTYYINDGQGGYTLIADTEPANDVCDTTTNTSQMTGKNIGDLMNGAGIPWGGFMGGFNLTVTNANGTTGCKRSTASSVIANSVEASGNLNKLDYGTKQGWFQYFASTANPTHARPSAVAAIGQTYQADNKTLDPANHQYDIQDFFSTVQAGNFPAVNYLKAPEFQNGHAGYSDPLDEQAFVTQVINFLQQQPDWKNTLVIVTYDDSDGWYDHQPATITSPSFDSQVDQLNGPGKCGSGVALPGVGGKPVNGRCGPGMRVPFLVISPWAKVNYVDHTQISQASIVRFIEDNWLNGQRLGGGAFDANAGVITNMLNLTGTANVTPLWLDPIFGTPVSSPPIDVLAKNMVSKVIASIKQFAASIG